MGRDPYQSYPAAQWIGDPDLDGWPLTLNVYLGASVIALALMAFGRGRRLSMWLGILAAIASDVPLAAQVVLVVLGRGDLGPEAQAALARSGLPDVAWLSLLADKVVERDS